MRNTKLIVCQTCQVERTEAMFNCHHDICDYCVDQDKEDKIYCEPCTKLYDRQIKAVTNVKSVPVCEHCGKVVNYVQGVKVANDEREMLIMIRLGKIPF